MQTFLIADDHEIVRHGIRIIIETLPIKFIIIETDTCIGLMQVFSSQKPDYAIMDMVLADGNVFFDTPLLSQYASTTNILVYSMNGETIYARRLLQRGVRGFVSKKSGIAELEHAIRTFLNGEVYVSQDLKQLLTQYTDTAFLNPIDSLSDRELEVVEYSSMGMRVKEIAYKMKLDATTVSTYRQRAFKKLNVENIFELKEKFLLYKL